VVSPLVRLAFRLRIPDPGDALISRAAQSRGGRSGDGGEPGLRRLRRLDDPSARRWRDRRIVINDTLFVAACWEAVGNAAKVVLQPGAPHEFLNLRDRISAEADARRAMADFVDRVLRG
jgi:hypothetical protein